jgi:hypothetical protein
LLVLAPPAQAAIPGIPEDAGADDGTVDDIVCTVQSGAGERHCSGIFTTFDGAPIDVNVGSNLELRLPVLEKPNGALIQRPAAKVVPAGYELAADFAKFGGCKGKDCKQK